MASMNKTMAPTNKTMDSADGEDGPMAWAGSWRNQYGSILKIIDEGNGRIGGSFSSAVGTKTKGEEIAIIGLYQDNLISFMLSGGSHVVSWTGLVHDGRMETLWHLVVRERLTPETHHAPAKQKPIGVWEAFTTGSDIFERVG
jgi:Avidin family